MFSSFLYKTSPKHIQPRNVQYIYLILPMSFTHAVTHHLTGFFLHLQCLNIVQYPVHWTAQSILHFIPWLADMFIPTPTRLLYKAFSNNTYWAKTIHSHVHRCLWPGIHLYNWVDWGIVERTEMSKLWNSSKGDSISGSLDWVQHFTAVSLCSTQDTDITLRIFQNETYGSLTFSLHDLVCSSCWRRQPWPCSRGMCLGRRRTLAGHPSASSTTAWEIEEEGEVKDFHRRLQG